MTRFDPFTSCALYLLAGLMWVVGGLGWLADKVSKPFRFAAWWLREKMR